MTTTEHTLVLLGQPRPLQLTELEPGTSPTTGKSLQRFEFEAVINGDDNDDRFHDQLTAAERGDEWITDNSGGRWKVRHYSVSYRDGQQRTMYNYRVEIEEHEEVKLAAVEFGDVSLTPSKWKIDCDPDGREMLEILFTASTEQSAMVETFMQTDGEGSSYFPVNWVGVRAEGTSMRFGRCTWSPTEDAEVKHHIVLVSERGDEKRLRGFSEPEASQVRHKSARTTAKLEALITELQVAGLLDTEAMGRIEAAAPTFAHLREFDRDDFLEDWFD